MPDRVDRRRDEILILEYRAGDLNALEALISRWQVRIYCYVLTLARDKEAAWDICQDVWLATISGLRKSERIRNFPAWLYRVAHNKAVSHLRKTRRLEERKDALLQVAEEDSDGTPDLLNSVDDALLVHTCLRELPLAQREVLGLFYLDDLSLGDIAQILDVPQGTVQSRLHYGRMKMKELLLKRGYSHDER